MGIREEVFYEGGSHIGDLIIGIFVGLTVVGVTLTVGAIVRALWLHFRITDRRISVIGGWMGRDRSDVIYSEVVKIVKLPRSVGLWGNMVLTLRDGNCLEMPALPRYREIYDYINRKVATRNPGKIGAIQG